MEWAVSVGLPLAGGSYSLVTVRRTGHRTTVSSSQVRPRECAKFFVATEHEGECDGQGQHGLLDDSKSEGSKLPAVSGPLASFEKSGGSIFKLHSLPAVQSSV